jgi:hypothetical protein
MKFMILVKATEESEAGIPPSAEAMTAMMKFNEELVNAGVMLAGEGISASSEGARVHFDGDDVTVVDGPFAETKELVSGFWMIQVKSLDEAKEWIKRAPNPTGSEWSLEIRRVLGPEDFQETAPEGLLEKEDELRQRVEGSQA